MVYLFRGRYGLCGRRDRRDFPESVERHGSMGVTIEKVARRSRLVVNWGDGGDELTITT